MAFSVFRNSKVIYVHSRIEDIFALIFYRCLLWDSNVCAPDALLKFSARTSDESAFDPKVTFDDDAINDRPWTDRRPMLTRMVVQTAIWLAAMAAILFLAAGDWGWPQGWVFLGEVAVSTFAVNLWLARHDPGLLASRLSAPVQRDQRPWDRTFMLVGLLVFIGWLVLCALDARRFGWSRVPLYAQAIGTVLIALCMIVVWQVFRFNSFAAPQVRVQIERQQRAITDGPYRIVRHPMYAGALLMFVGTPLLLGSWWGLLFVPLGALGIGIRAVGEERMLRRELAGYEAYTRHVRFRMVPGLW